MKNNSLTGADIRNGSLLKQDFKAGQLPRGARGAPGTPGPAGPQGATGAKGADAPLPPPPGTPVSQRLIVAGLGNFPVETTAWGGTLDVEPGGGGGGGAVHAEFEELAFLHVPDSFSPRLLAAIATGEHLDSASLEMSAPGGAPAATLDFEDITFSGLEAVGAGAERRESLTMRMEVADDATPLAFDATRPALPLHESKIGELEVDGIPRVIDLYSDTWGLVGGAPGAGGGTGKPAFEAFEVTKTIDAASPELLERMLQGAEIPEVTIRLFRPGTSSVESTFELEDAFVTGWHAASALSALERVSFNYEVIRQTTGGVTRCFDVVMTATC